MGDIPVKVLPWPKLLRDVKAGAAVRTKRALHNAHGVIAPGTIGTIDNRPHTWSWFTFIAMPCQDCGYRPIVSRIDKEDLELISIGGNDDV